MQIVLEKKQQMQKKLVAVTKGNLLKTTYKDPQTKNPYFYFSRYADDWILLIRGTREIAEEIKGKISKYLLESLYFTLSEKKNQNY